MYKNILLLASILFSACITNKEWPVDNSDPDYPCLEVIYNDTSYDLKTKSDYRKALYSEGMKTVWKYFEPHMLPEIRMELSKVNDSSIKVGGSKVGGLPDLPTTMAWPSSSEAEQLKFIAQLNFEDLKNYKPASEYLPRQGLLSFFFADTKEECWTHKGMPSCFKVIYTANAQLSRKELPVSELDPKYQTYPSCKIDFEEAYGMPPWSYNYIEKYASKAEDCTYGDGHFMMTYMNIRNGIMDGSDHSKIFGHADEIQGEMKADDEEWMILFQLDSERNASMQWNDGGLIYFWIKKTDLAVLNFENMDIIIQGH